MAVLVDRDVADAGTAQLLLHLLEMLLKFCLHCCNLHIKSFSIHQEMTKIAPPSTSTIMVKWRFDNPARQHAHSIL